MPFLSAKLRNDVIFTEFYANGCFTGTSHFSLFSGGLAGRANPKLTESFVQGLKSSGYQTYGISANPMVGTELNYPLGFDVFDADVGRSHKSPEELIKKKESFDRLMESANPMSAFLEVHLSTTADIVSDRAILALADHFRSSKGRPFFLFVNYLETHDPYFPHSPSLPGVNYNFRDKDGLPYEFLRRVPEQSNREIQGLRKLYDNEIAYLDAHLHRLLNYLNGTAARGKTVFILTSDHGEILGEHDLFGHDLGLYREEIEIPFIIFGAGLKGKKVAGLYSLIDAGEIVKCLAAGKPGRIRKLGRTRVIQRHYVSDADEKAFLPVRCRVDLLRVTFPRYSMFYYRHGNRDFVKGQDNGTGKEWRLPISREDREIIENEIAAFKGALSQDRSIGKALEETLRSLGYIR